MPKETLLPRWLQSQGRSQEQVHQQQRVRGRVCHLPFNVHGSVSPLSLHPTQVLGPSSRAELSHLSPVALVLSKMMFPFPLPQARKRGVTSLYGEPQKVLQAQQQTGTSSSFPPPPPSPPHRWAWPPSPQPFGCQRGQSGAVAQNVLSVAEQVLHGKGFPGIGIPETLKKCESPSQDKDHRRWEILGSAPRIAASCYWFSWLWGG